MENLFNNAYDNYLSKINWMSGVNWIPTAPHIKWCKIVTNPIDGYVSAEPYSEKEFEERLIRDDEFNEMWSNGCTVNLSDAERIQIWKQNNPNHPPRTPIKRELLYNTTPKRKII